MFIPITVINNIINRGNNRDIKVDEVLGGWERDTLEDRSSIW